MARKVWLALAATLLVLAACGGGEGGTTGTGYAVDLPDGWSDKTSEAENYESPIEFDRFLAKDRQDGFSTNANVLYERAPAGATLDEVEVEFKRQLQQFGAKGVTPAEDREVGGEPGRSREYRVFLSGQALRGRQVFTIHDGLLYTITFSARRDAFGADQSGFERLLDSWRWD